MESIKVLFINNTGGSGNYYRNELKRLGHVAVLITKENIICDGKTDYEYSKKGFKQLISDYGTDYFDIVHINSPNSFLLKDVRRFMNLDKAVFHFRGRDIRESMNTKFIYHYHGSDIRLLTGMIVKNLSYLLNHKLYHSLPNHFLYSTIDLRWFIKAMFPNSTPYHLRTPIDVHKFKNMIPLDERPYDKLIWGKGSFKSSDDWIPHDEVPMMLNKYKEVTCYPNGGINPHIVSISALESASCGCKVTHHPYMDRKWVIEHASVESQTNKLLKYYYKFLDE